MSNCDSNIILILRVFVLLAGNYDLLQLISDFYGQFYYNTCTCTRNTITTTNTICIGIRK